MKKIYQSPETEVVMVQSAQMIAASVNLYGSDATGEGLAREVDDLLFFEDDEF